ncbi:hypothetical protein BDV93DRAFT_515408 [Ceratobasidium sp. AG-I]|nr:hypothetical protein BDV93DRAFT_515408 [Ceratobasidium sp. AG-I]
MMPTEQINSIRQRQKMDWAIFKQLPHVPPPLNVSPNQKSVIHSLLNHNSGYMTSRTLYDIADYLVTIHDKYTCFHNGGIPQAAPQLSVLERAAVVGLDIIEHTPQEDKRGDLQGDYSLCPEAIQGLSHAITKTSTMLHQVCNAAMPASEMEEWANDPYKAFRYHHMLYVSEPDCVRNIASLTQHYRHKCTLETVVNETQLWVAFTQLSCSLLALAKSLDCPDVRFFDAEMFRRCHVAVKAHNWYMEEAAAPEDYILAPWV